MTNSDDERSWRYAGWRVVAVLFLVEMSIFGFCIYGQGIYVTEIRRLNGWPTGLIASGTTLSLVLGSLLSIFSGDVLRWIGPRQLVLGGIAALATGLMLLASVSSIPQLYSAFVVLSLSWIGLGTVAAAAILGAWFDRKRGLAISLTFTGASCSGILLAPGLVLFVGAVGFHSALTIAAIAMVVVLVPIVTAMIRFPSSYRSAEVSAASPSVAVSRWALMHDKRFWLLTAPFALALFVQVAFIVHQIAILTPTIGFQSAGGAVSLTTFMALAGRIGLGLFVDRLDPRRVAAMSMLSQAAALCLIAQSSSTQMLFLASAMFGLSIGNLTTLPTLIVQREFTPGLFSIVLGLSIGISGIFNSCGPAAMGFLHDMTGSYTPPLFVGVAVLVISALMVLIKPPDVIGDAIGS